MGALWSSCTINRRPLSSTYRLYGMLMLAGFTRFAGWASAAKVNADKKGISRSFFMDQKAREVVNGWIKPRGFLQQIKSLCIFLATQYPGLAQELLLLLT